MSKIVIFILLLLSLGLIGALLGFSYYNSTLDSSLSLDQDKIFTIESGDSVEKILENLEKEGVVKNKEVLMIYLKLNPDVASNFKAGTFIIDKDTNLLALTETFQDASTNRDDIAVLIQEGLRYDEIAEILETAYSDIPESKFMTSEYISISENPDDYQFTEKSENFLSDYKPSTKSLEGFLYPDTYYFSKTATAQEIIEKQISTLSEKISTSDYGVITGSDYSLYEHLIVASMIEREAFSSDEKADIADVMFKRLENGIQGVKLLQIYATLLYQAKDWKANPFLIKDVDGPYNTYKRAGLPPTPISNPGIDSLRASLYPNSNTYYFYLHDSDGNIHFAEDASEHNANVRKYINN
jgi:UPF0755 protein